MNKLEKIKQQLTNKRGQNAEYPNLSHKDADWLVNKIEQLFNTISTFHLKNDCNNSSCETCLNLSKLNE